MPAPTTANPEETQNLVDQANTKAANLKAGKATDSTKVVEVCLKEKEAAAAGAAAAAASVVSVKNAAGTVKDLIAKTNDKKDAVKRQEAVTELAALAESASTFRAYEPFVVMQALPAVMVRAEDKQALVREAAAAAAEKIVRAMSPYVVGEVLLKVLAEFMTEEAKWRVKKLAVELVGLMADLYPRQVAAELNNIIVHVKPSLFDIKKEVAAAALATMNKAFSVVDNKDIVPFLPALVKAMADPETVQECIHELASTTFVANVEAPHLAVIAPLLVRGFREPVVAVKRQCAVIVANMSKLVLSPAEAAPLLPELLPCLKRAADEISNPEARGVAERARDQILRIEAATQAAVERRAGQNAAIDGYVKEGVCHNKSISPEALSYIAAVASNMVDCKHFDELYWTKFMTPMVAALDGAATAVATTDALRVQCNAYATFEPEEEEMDDGEELCNCKFTLAYGTKILLHNTQLRLNRGCRYGLLGGNDSGKTTLMRAIAKGQVDGFPPATELRTVFVEADIQGEMSHLSCIDYIFADEAIQACNIPRPDISAMLLSVGFSEKMVDDAVTTLSGGWRMKLALARAMLQKADILLLDEPTNHLDVINVKWVETYLNSLKDVTSIIVSHDAGLLDHCATHILSIADLKLHLFRGNLSEYVKLNPSAKSFFELTASKLKFKFPQPGYLEGVKSKGKALMKMDKCTFTYPGNTVPTIRDITVQVSLSSRVACVGVNGAGKSTMIKLLTGVNEPQQGTVWVHQHARIAYVAQHAFAHIEKHLNKTATQYLQWRYENGEDKEGLEKSSMKLTAEEEAKLREPVVVEEMDAAGKIKKVKKVIARLTGSRRQAKKLFEYELMWDKSGATEWMLDIKLEELGWGKHLKAINAKIEARDGAYARPLTQESIEEHIEDVGLSREFASHYRMSALSGGQKVKVVLAAAMWNQPHILILDEPTNYLDRESLGALAGAIREYEGGVVMITHNNEFCSALCPETWVLENGTLDCRGDADWMKNAVKDKVEFKMVEEMVDASGNTVKIKQPKKKLSRKERMAREKRRKMLRELGEEVSDSDDE